MDDDDDSPPRRQRLRSPDEEEEDEEDEAFGMEGNDGSREQMVKKLVRYALACEYARMPITRKGISEIGGHPDSDHAHGSRQQRLENSALLSKLSLMLLRTS